MTDTEIEGLRIVLLALLPADGSPLTVGTLARVASASADSVLRALEADRTAGRVRYDPLDGFSAVKQGNDL